MLTEVAKKFVIVMKKNFAYAEEVSCLLPLTLGKHLTGCKANIWFSSVVAALVLSTEPGRTHCAISVCRCRSGL